MDKKQVVELIKAQTDAFVAKIDSFKSGYLSALADLSMELAKTEEPKTDANANAPAQ